MTSRQRDAKSYQRDTLCFRYRKLLDAEWVGGLKYELLFGRHLWDVPIQNDINFELSRNSPRTRNVLKLKLITRTPNRNFSERKEMLPRTFVNFS